MPDIFTKEKRSDVMSRPWFVYVVRCADGTLYTGITTDLARRMAAHDVGTGAKYTRGRGPIELVWSRRMKTGTLARKLEAAIKRRSKTEKEHMIQSA